MATTTTTVNTGQLVQWLLEYGQRVRDIQERAWVYSHPSYVEKGLPLLYGAMQLHPQLLYGTSGGDAKAQKEFVRGLADKAQTYLAEVQPLVSSLKIISQNFASIAQLLAELHRVLGSLTLRSFPDLLHQYMDTFCGAVKAGLLLEEVPRKAVAQMVHLACQHLNREAAAPLLAATEDTIFSASSMVAYLQKLFRASMPRIGQVLELVVGPAMTVADNCEGVASAGLLEMSPSPQPTGTSADADGSGSARVSVGGGEVETSPAMGMFGMTRQQVYPFLRHREVIRQWGLLGFLVFPEILCHSGSSKRLSMLLSDGFALHVYKDRVACAHQLALTHLGSVAASMLGTGSSASNGCLSPRSSGLGGLLGKGMAMIGGGVGRLRKSTMDDSDSHEQQIHPVLVDAAYTAAVAAPLQHRMWRAYLIGQLRNIHAACMACPTRIPGQMEMLLAALSLAREEILWFCRHLKREAPAELVPILVARGALHGSQLLTPMPEDNLQALQLLSAMDSIHRMLVDNHVSLCKQIKETIGADLQTHVVPCTPRVEFRLRQAAAQASGAAATTATSTSSSANGLQPFKDLTDLLRGVLLSSNPPTDAAARVSSACGIWMYVSLQLASVDPPLKAAKVLQYAEDTRYLDVLQKALDAARLLYEGPLLHASAADLAPGLQYLVEHLFAAARTALSSGRAENMAAGLGAMQGLHWLLPARSEAYAAAANAPNTASALLSRNSAGHPAGGRPSAGETAASAALLGGRATNSRRTLNVSPDDLPRRCMDLVVGCLRALLHSLVQAPLINAASLNSASRPSNSHNVRNSSSSALMKAVIAKSKSAEGQAAAAAANPVTARSSTPEQLRVDGAGGATSGDGTSGKTLVTQLQLPLTGALDAREGADEAHEGPVVVARESYVELVTLPSAAELAARLMPLVLALDNGRMLIANGIDAIPICRAQLVDAVRENFGQLLANTASAISKVAVPVPSLQLGPLRRFIEVFSILQPHLSTELLPELARMLLHQTSAPTLQTIGLEASSAPLRLPNVPAPPSTSAEVVASTNPNADTPATARAGSINSGLSTVGAVGPMTRSLAANVSANTARNSPAVEPERNVGPLTAALSASAGGASAGNTSSTTSSGPAATTSVVRALAAWLWSTLVLDERRQGIWYDAEAANFAAAADHAGSVGSSSSSTAVPTGVAVATGVRELSLIFELFGPCAAADLTRGCDQLIHSCLEQLQAFLDANQGPLQELLDSAHLPLDKRLSAVQRALPLLTPPNSTSVTGRGPQCLGSLADSVQRLGRCLALRVQLGRASASAIERVADFVTLALREMATPVNVSNGGAPPAASGVAAAAVPALERREWASLLRLSAGGSVEVDCSYGSCLLPDRDDALLTAHLASMIPGLAAAQRWHRMPALLAALMAAPQWNPGAAAGGPVPSRKGSFTPRGTTPVVSNLSIGQQSVSAAVVSLGAISTVTVSMLLSLQAAMSQVLHPAASQFLLGCGAPVGAMLCAFQRLALAVTQAASYGTTGTDTNAAATAAKQHMLACLEHTPLLKAYAYSLPSATAEDAATGADGAEPSDAGGQGEAVGLPTPLSSLDLGQGWWATNASSVGASVSAASQNIHKLPGPVVPLDVGEPSLVDGRWSGEIDPWRPPSRLLPLVMGQVG